MYPDSNIDLRPAAIERQLRMLFERELAREVGRITRAIKRHPKALRLHARFTWRLKGGFLFDFELDEKP